MMLQFGRVRCATLLLDCCRIHCALVATVNREYEECLVFRFDEVFDCLSGRAEEVFDSFCRSVPDSDPDRLRRRSVQERELTDVRVFRHDDVLVRSRVVPYVDVTCGIQTDQRDVGARGGRRPRESRRGDATGSDRTAASRRDCEAALTHSRELQSRANVILGELGEVLDDLGGRHPAGEVLKHVVDRDPRADEAGLAAPNTGPYLDQSQQGHARAYASQGQLLSRFARKSG